MIRSKVRRVGLMLVALCGAAAAVLRADPFISEFMASNTATLRDEDGAYSDWIEIHNPDPTAANLAGWYLSDSAGNKTRWQFPAVTLAPGAYLVVFASNKDRRDPARQLHTNFALANEGEYLGLIRPDGTTAASEFAPSYPPQSNGVSYGFIGTGSSRTAVFFTQPTPGSANTSTGGVRLGEIVRFSRAAGQFTTPFALELSGAGPGQHIRYETAAPSGFGAVAAEPTATSPRYAGPLTIGTTTLIRAAVFSDDLGAQGPFSSAQYFQIVTSGPGSVASFTSPLPVLVIEQHGLGELSKEVGQQPARFYGYNPRPLGTPVFSTPPNFGLPALVSVRGSSSANFPKSSYNIDLLNDSGRGEALPLFGLPEFDEWALIGPWWYDPSLIRNSFIYALSNRIGRWAPRTRPIEVFRTVDGEPLDQSAYVGVYALTDKPRIEKNRIDIREMPANAVPPADITGGYLLKIDLPDADEYSWRTEGGLDVDTISSVVVTSPKADRLSAPQRDYIRGYVQRMENALMADRAGGWRTRTYLDYIDRASWVDHHILNTFASNPDAFERSAYFQKDRGGKLVAGPVWDFDRALGSAADERSLRTDAWHGQDAVQVWHFGWWGVIATDPEFMQDWIDRWQSLRRSHFADQSLTALVDQLATAVGPEAAARDAARWPDNRSEFGGTHAGEIAHLRNWLVQRARWIDLQFLAAPTASSGAGGVTLTPAAGAQLAYTLDGSDPRALGGDLAPNATLAGGPVTVPASSNVQARSYRAGSREAFPGSPWSSAVGGPNSTPLSPASRLINLASRGITGAGENALIAGVVVADTTEKRYLTRAIGPALVQFGATDAIADPQLVVFSGGGAELFRNAGWSTAPNSAELVPLARSVGAFPLASGSNDSALVPTLASGSYTMQAASRSGASGIGLVELYELDGHGRTLNLSTRAQVGAGERVLIGGFVVQGVAHKRMLIRAVGPGLSGFGVANVVRDPVLTIHSGQAVIATNDRWSEGGAAAAVSAAGTRVGAFALAANSEDAALLVTLPPGAYTAQVAGKDAQEGVALLEIYEVP